MPMDSQAFSLNTNTRLSSAFRAWDIYVPRGAMGLTMHLLYLVPTGIAVEGATDAARGAADIVLTEPGFTIVHRMRNYAIYACSVTIRIVVAFAVLAFTYKFDFPPFMVLIIDLLNDGTIMTLSVDRVLPSGCLGFEGNFRVWALSYCFNFGETTFFQRKFGVNLNQPGPVHKNDSQLHMIAYLQVAIISQAFIFVTRSHGFFLWNVRHLPFFEPLSLCHCPAGIVNHCGLRGLGVHECSFYSGGWIGIIWLWNIVCVFPIGLDQVCDESDGDQMA